MFYTVFTVSRIRRWRLTLFLHWGSQRSECSRMVGRSSLLSPGGLDVIRPIHTFAHTLHLILNIHIEEVFFFRIINCCVLKSLVEPLITTCTFPTALWDRDAPNVYIRPGLVIDERFNNEYSRIHLEDTVWEEKYVGIPLTMVVSWLIRWWSVGRSFIMLVTVQIWQMSFMFSIFEMLRAI